MLEAPAEWGDIEFGETDLQGSRKDPYIVDTGNKISDIEPWRKGKKLGILGLLTLTRED